MIAGYIITWIFTLDAPEKRNGGIIREIIVKNIAAKQKQIWRFRFDCVYQLALIFPIITGMQIGYQGNTNVP